MSLWSLQKALYTRLLTTGYNVYDNVPEDAVCPYITLGEDTAIPWDTKDTDGEEVTVTLHCWSEYPGKKEAKEILAKMIDVLKTPLNIEGHTLSFQKWQSLQVLDDPDGITKHGVLRITFRMRG